MKSLLTKIKDHMQMHMDAYEKMISSNARGHARKEAYLSNKYLNLWISLQKFKHDELERNYDATQVSILKEHCSANFSMLEKDLKELEQEMKSHYDINNMNTNHRYADVIDKIIDKFAEEMNDLDRNMSKYSSNSESVIEVLDNDLHECYEEKGYGSSEFLDKAEL